MITLKNVSLRFGSNVLLDNINWTIYQKQHIGLIGANGSGKTTLFAFLSGNFHADSGDLTVAKGLKLGVMAQEIHAQKESALTFVINGDAELRSYEKKLEEALEKNDANKIATMHEKLAHIDAYTAEARAAQLLAGLGFKAYEFQKEVKEFSGGWRVRLNLARTLMMRSDVLLLDEPTNHLDLDAILWLQTWLKKYNGTLIIISHDREFLDEVVDHIAHIKNKTLTMYPGNYSAFEKQYAAQILNQQAAYQKQQEKISHLMQFVNRFRAKATKAKQAQSRLKAIARMENVCAVQTETAFQFEFKIPKLAGNPLIKIDNVTVGYDDKIILKEINLSIAPKDRIALLGPNGAGKSSLIKTLAGEIKVLNGSVILASGVKIGYFAQHQVDNLDLSASALLHLQRISNQSETDLRKYLGGFDFSGDKVLTPVKSFSGGEKSRLALALIIYQNPNLLLLDEPTNHLDLEMRNALSLALQEYEGALILVSHDRYLVKTTAEQLYLVADQKLQTFDGDLSDYEKWLIEYQKQFNRSDSKNSEINLQKNRRQEAVKNREMLRPLLQKIKNIEDQLSKLHVELQRIESYLADEKSYADHEKEGLKNYLQKQNTIKKEISALENDWLQLSEERDLLQSTIDNSL